MRAQKVGQVRRQGIGGRVVLGIAFAVIFFVTGQEGAAQYGTQRTTSTSTSTSGGPTTPGNTTQPGLPSGLDRPDTGGADPSFRAHMDAERLKAANDDRHKKLVADVERLISLTNELKTDVDKANKDELSVNVIRKAQEIEKLAHDVQNRMKN